MRKTANLAIRYALHRAAILLGFGLSIFTAMIALAAAPTIEGRHLPVIKWTTIDRIEPDHDRGGSLIWGRSFRKRPCEFYALNWYWQINDRRVRVPVTFIERPKIRDLGWFEFGPWHIPLSREAIESQTFAVAEHECHWLWRTVTTFKRRP